jgi:competence protein ComGC
MKRFKDAIMTKYLMLRNEERGMEAAQVILILAIVTGLIVLIFPPILQAIQDQGNDAVNDINGL